MYHVMSTSGTNKIGGFDQNFGWKAFGGAPLCESRRKDWLNLFQSLPPLFLFCFSDPNGERWISNAAELLFCGCVLFTGVQTFLAEDQPHSEILLSQGGMVRISKEAASD